MALLLFCELAFGEPVEVWGPDAETLSGEVDLDLIVASHILLDIQASLALTFEVRGGTFVLDCVGQHPFSVLLLLWLQVASWDLFLKGNTMVFSLSAEV